MVDQLSSYRNYVGVIRLLLGFTGLWPNKKWDYTAYLVPVVNILMCFTMSLVVLNFCYDHSNNLGSLTKGIGIMGSYLSALLKTKETGHFVETITNVFYVDYKFSSGNFDQSLRLRRADPTRPASKLPTSKKSDKKVVCFLVNRKDLVDLHRTLEANFDEALADPTVRIVILDSLSIFKKPSFAITTLIFIATLLYLITPVIVIIVQLSHNVHPLKFLLPYPGKYPWTFEIGGIVYYAHYAWEIFAGLSLFCVTSGVDSLFGYYVYQIQATFRLMSLRMRNLRFEDHDAASVIRDCVAKHCILEKCRDHLQKIYGPIVLWMFLTSAVIMCTLIFQTSQTRGMTIGHAILFTVYISMKLVQALMYAWYGNVIITESDDFREAVYSCDWPGSGDTSLMSDVLIMMNQKSLVLKAGKFLIVSTDMFTAIVNTTMSYFFLLQTLDEGN